VRRGIRAGFGQYLKDLQGRIAAAAVASAFDEGKQIGVELILVGVAEAVRGTRIHDKRRAFDQFYGGPGGCVDGHDLVVVAVDDVPTGIGDLRSSLRDRCCASPLLRPG
jgi:hypothetical protein